jgi:three-Cys-motif partner protein
MASSKKNDVISVAPPHSIKKFELISEYVKAWINILMLNKDCKGIVYIDCMSNSGVYYDDQGKEIEGTPLLVSEIIAEAMTRYTNKKAYIYFNDLDSRKIDLLKTRLPKQTGNFTIYTESMDANELLRKIGEQFSSMFSNMHFLLVYDPYDAHIEWDAMMPFLKNWGEIIINHMVSDTIRAAKMAKKPEVIEKYEETYRTTIDELIAFGSDRNAFEKKIEQIILDLSGRKNGRYYLAAFPFFNSNNSVIYNLIHCTGHYRGFELFKSTAWKTFGDKSSMKNTHNNQDQMQFRFTDDGDIVLGTPADESCYNLRDAAKYVQEHFAGKSDVPNDEVWAYLGEHPVFPTRDYKNKIKDVLKREYGTKTSVSSMTFTTNRSF